MSEKSLEHIRNEEIYMKEFDMKEFDMKEFEMHTIVGETFEDLSISEMVQVQGSGDVIPETTVPCALAASFSLSIGVVRTLKGHC